MMEENSRLRATGCGETIPHPRGAHPRARTGSARGRQTSPRRVRDLIAMSIRMGYIHPDIQLHEHELVELFSTSRTSIREALAQLTSMGMIERRPRAGTRIRRLGLSLPLVDVSKEGQDVRMEIVDARLITNFPLVRDHLELDDEHIRMIEIHFHHAGSVVGIRTAYYSADVPLPDERMQPVMTMVDVLDEFQQQPGEVDVRISADIADARDSRIMNVREGAPVVVRELTYYAASGAPVEIVFDRFRADWVSLEGTSVVPHPPTA